MSAGIGQCDRDHFRGGFRAVQDAVYSNAKDKGFWDKERNIGEALFLMVCEICEAGEASRDGTHHRSEKIPNYTHVEEELADAIIRVMDFAGGFDLDVVGAIIAKHRYNQTRPHMHGKKF